MKSPKEKKLKMKIENIKIKKVEGKEVKGYVSFTLNGVFVIHNARIVEGNNRLLVAMPSRKVRKGFQDICHPITLDFRKELETAIINEFNKME